MKIRIPLHPARWIFVVLLAACGGGSEPAPLSTLPAAGMAGQSMVVLPVQRPGDFVAEAENELVYALRQRHGTDNWVFPDEVRRVMARSPSMDAPVDALPVDLFLRAEVERVGDPLYGMLRRVAALTGSTRVLIPVGVSFRPAGPDQVPPVESAVEVLAGVVDVVSGRVIWLDVAEGEASSPDDPAGLPRAMGALAASLLPAR